MSESVDLSLVPLEAICAEAMRRCKSGIMLLEVDGKDTKIPLFWNWTGDYYQALGFCSEMEKLIKSGEDPGDDLNE